MRLATLGLAAALTACSGSAAKLSVSTKVTGGATATAAAPAAAGKALAIGTHVTLDRARILVRKVVLEGTETESSSEDGTTTGGTPGTAPTPGSDVTAAEGMGSGDGSAPGSEADDETVVRAGPFVIDLSGAALGGGVTLLFDQPVPAGTYDGLTFQIHGLTPGETVTDADFTALGHSIILGLTVDGAPFTFTSDLTAVAKVDGPITVATGANANVTVTIDPSGWFTAADGSFLDPRVDANRSQIEQNIRASIRGFEDDDHDGEPDHGS